MDNLILNSLEIQNFRAFRHLGVEKLGRVNLFVGKNNVGKSSLLEALWLYANEGELSVIWQLLEARNELQRSSTSEREAAQERLVAIQHLFHRLLSPQDTRNTIVIGSGSTPDPTLSISLNRQTKLNDFTSKLSFIALKYFQSLTNLESLASIEDQEEDEVEPLVTAEQVPSFAVQKAKHPLFSYVFGFGKVGGLRLTNTNIRAVLIPAHGLEALQIERFWDQVALTSLEHDILAALQIIAPEVERINLIGNQDRQVVGSSTQRIPIVKVADLDEPIPLRSLGEGMNRMFGIALALANAKNGMLLIDEVESGLHYSIQPDMWRLIFEMAHRLNVQIFATTHSWDCIAAFQQAAREDVHEEGLLIRLERRNDDVRATLFDEEDLAIVTREQIEVR